MRVLTSIQNNLFYITLNNPFKGNCYDGEMTKEISTLFVKAGSASGIQAIILQGNGANFCTGADLSWMAQACDQTAEENYEEMEKIFFMYKTILNCPVPIIAIAKGSTAGGGMGLLSASDVVLCSKEATFSLPEKKWGLIPGIITPIVIAKIGEEHFNDLAVHAKKIRADEALKMGLVQNIVDVDNFEKYLMPILEKGIKRKTFPNEMENELKRYLGLSALKRQEGEFCEKIKKHFS